MFVQKTYESSDEVSISLCVYISLCSGFLIVIIGFIKLRLPAPERRWSFSSVIDSVPFSSFTAVFTLYSTHNLALTAGDMGNRKSENNFPCYSPIVKAYYVTQLPSEQLSHSPLELVHTKNDELLSSHLFSNSRQQTPNIPRVTSSLLFGRVHPYPQPTTWFTHHILLPVRYCILSHGTLAQQALNATCNPHKPNSFFESSTKLCYQTEDKTRLHSIGADCSTDARKGLKFAKRLSTKWPGRLVISYALQKSVSLIGLEHKLKNHSFP